MEVAFTEDVLSLVNSPLPLKMGLQKKNLTRGLDSIDRGGPSKAYF